MQRYRRSTLSTAEPSLRTSLSFNAQRRTPAKIAMAIGLAALAVINSRLSAREYSNNELSYESYIDSDKRIKCLYGYAAEKTGDHEAARQIFEDCIRRWNDVYSMIWLADIYENGSGVPADPIKATALLRQGALAQTDVPYGALARFHYGVALYEGRGTAPDRSAGMQWLERAAREGVREAETYLERIKNEACDVALGVSCPPDGRL